MAKHRHQTYAPFKQTASGSAGHVELWHSNDQLLWSVICGIFSGTDDRPTRKYDPRAIKAMVQGEKRSWLSKAIARTKKRESFVPLLQWILSWWPSDEKSLVLAADASTLGERFTVLAISVVYRGCGIPVAWKIVSATAKGSWKPHWLKLLEQLQGGIPSDWKVIVTTDRGLYAKWFYEAIKDLLLSSIYAH